MSGLREREALSLYKDRFTTESKKQNKINGIIKKLNKIYSREVYHINDNGCLVFKNKNEEEHQYIANFFVVPTHWIYCSYEDAIDDCDGLAVTVYHNFDGKTYERVHVNLKNDSIEKGDWVNPKYLDYFFDLPIQSNYRYLRAALKLATKRIKSKKKKLFDGEKWLVGREANDRIKQYFKDYSVNQIYLSDITQKESLEKDSLEFLKSIQEYIKINKLTNFNTKPENETNHIGWNGDAENKTIYLLPKNLNSWIKEQSPNISTQRDMINSYLIKQEILSTETESNGRVRIDVNKTVHTSKKKRVIVIDREKFERFLSTHT